MSDSDSVDSDEGIRYKTENVRNQQEDSSCQNMNTKKKHRRRSSSTSPSLSDVNKKETLFKKTDEMDNKSKKEMQTVGPVPPSHFLNKGNSEIESSLIGPALPPHLRKSSSDLPSVEGASSLHITQLNSSEQSREISIGPQLPSCKKNTDEISLTSSESSQSESSFGPELPPHLRNILQSKSTFGFTDDNLQCKETNDKILGPSLPPHLRKQLEEQAEPQSQEEIDSGDDQEIYGPLPVGMKKHSASEIALEERALQLQIDKLSPQDNSTPVRESWMTDLPEAKAANFGLGPRQFRNRAGPDLSDRSSWTDIAGEKDKHKKKEKKIDLKAEAELRELQKRDNEQELMAKKHKRKSKSLIEIHQDKLRKKEEGASSSERRPFNRETDLQVNKFDDAQRKAVLKKAQLLDDRFSSGNNKYL